jgi:hypothetical protein
MMIIVQDEILNSSILLFSEFVHDIFGQTCLSFYLTLDSPDCI